MDARSRRTAAGAEAAEALRRVRVVMIRAQSAEPPTDLDAIARTLGIRSIRQVPLPMHGRIVRDANEIDVEIRENLHPTDQRFALAHELCHVVLEGKAARDLPLGVVQRPASRSLHAVRERLCDLGAAEMLVPTDWLLKAFSGAGGFGVSDAVDAATLADVRIDLIVRRLRELGLWNGTALWLRVENGRCFPCKAFPEWDESMLARARVYPETASVIAGCVRTRSLYEGPIRLEIIGQHEDYQGQCVPTADNEVLALLSALPVPLR